MVVPACTSAPSVCLGCTQLMNAGAARGCWPPESPWSVAGKLSRPVNTIVRSRNASIHFRIGETSNPLPYDAGVQSFILAPLPQQIAAKRGAFGLFDCADIAD